METIPSVFRKMIFFFFGKEARAFLLLSFKLIKMGSLSTSILGRNGSF